MGDGLRVLVDRHQTTCSRQLCQDAGTVTAAAESTIDVEAVRIRYQLLDRLFQQNCGMAECLTHAAPLPGCALKRQGLQCQRNLFILVNLQVLITCTVPELFTPD